MTADAFKRGEHPGYEAASPVRVGNVACRRFRLGIFGEVVGMMSVVAEMLCRIGDRLAEEYDVGRRSHVAAFSCAFSHLTAICMVSEIRAAESAAKRVVW